MNQGCTIAGGAGAADSVFACMCCMCGCIRKALHFAYAGHCTSWWHDGMMIFTARSPANTLLSLLPAVLLLQSMLESGVPRVLQGLQAVGPALPFPGQELLGRCVCGCVRVLLSGIMLVGKGA